MEIYLSKAALLVFALSAMVKGFEMYTGVKLSINPQCKNSCLNGGTRVDESDGRYRCECVSGFTGIICQNCKGCQDDSEYTGIRSWTFTKKTCQRWDSQTPHNHTHVHAGVYDGEITNVSQAENYCRNPDLKTGGPWCFTTDPTKRWEYCDVPICHGCQQIGKEYIGTKNSVGVDRTDDTIHCHRWEDVHRSFTAANFSGGIETLCQAENYCRNPDNDANGPWCYADTTEGMVKKYCHVPYCHGCHSEGVYGGTRSQTKAGLTCQRWDSQSPHPHNVTNVTTFTDNITTHLNEAENYCRIVEDYATRKEPWCYTTANNTEWDYCGVPECQALTLNEQLEGDY